LATCQDHPLKKPGQEKNEAGSNSKKRKEKSQQA